MQNRAMTLQFSSGGLDRKVSFRQTPPYASRRMKNVRVEETGTYIMRGGQRPGTSKQYSSQLGSGSIVNMMGQATLATGGGGGSGRYVFQDVFWRDEETDLGGVWATPSWLTQQPIAKMQGGENPTSLPDSGGAVMTGTGLNSSAEYSIELTVEKDTSSPYTLNNVVSIYAMLDNTSPDFTKEGIAVVFDVQGETGVYSGVLIDVNNYVPTVYALTSGVTATGDAYGKLKVVINSNNVKVYWGKTTETLILNQNVTAKTGTGVGFDQNPTASGNGSLISSFLIEGTASSARPNQLRQDIMVVGSGGNVYYESTPGTLSQVSGASIESGHTIQCAQMFQKVYIADYNTAGTGVVHVLDPSDGSWSTLTATSGSVPTNCDMIARWHGRLVLAKEHLWYMCAVNNTADWQFGRATATTAVASQNSEAGSLGEPIRALCAASDDLLIFGCDNSIWALHGDPAWHGRLQNLSEDVGILDKFAWCFGPSGELYFLSKDGLYVVAPGGNSRPQALSRVKIPAELLNIDTGAMEVNLGWSQAEHGVYIAVTPYIASSGTNFFYQVETGTFWQDEYPSDQQPFRMFNYKPIYGKNAALLYGCRDGYVRKIDLSAVTDDQTNINSYIDIGPFLLFGDNTEAVLREINGYVSVGSGPITWDLRVADSAEAVMNAGSFATGTWTGAGLQYRVRPRARGHAALLRLGNSDAQGWSFEKATVVVEKRGRVRR